MSSPKLPSFLYSLFASTFCLFFHHRETVTQNIRLLFHTVSFMIFFISLSLSLCLCVGIFFLELWSLFDNGKNCYVCSKLSWNIQRIISHTSHFKAHSHYQPAQGSCFISFPLYPWSPTPFPFKHTLICLIYMLEYVCILLYCVVLNVHVLYI